MRLNLGCGGDNKVGFINIDISGGDVEHDLRLGLYPRIAFQDSVEFIYTSHFLEHIFDDEAAHLLKDCQTVLKPGGAIRICVPDFRKLAEAYLNEDLRFFNLLPVGDFGCPISFLEYCAYQYNGRENDHKALYDVQKLTKMLSAAGFVSVKEMKFDPSVDIDSEVRSRYSLYVEAKKP